MLACVAVVTAAMSTMGASAKPTSPMVAAGASKGQGHIVVMPKSGAVTSPPGPAHHADYVTGNVTICAGGEVMHNAVNYAIFWLPKGYTFDPTRTSS